VAEALLDDRFGLAAEGGEEVSECGPVDDGLVRLEKNTHPLRAEPAD
jgi:hypothetical protein